MNQKHWHASSFDQVAIKLAPALTYIKRGATLNTYMCYVWGHIMYHILCITSVTETDGEEERAMLCYYAAYKPLLVLKRDVNLVLVAM